MKWMKLKLLGRNTNFESFEQFKIIILNNYSNQNLWANTIIELNAAWTTWVKGAYCNNNKNR